MKKKTSKKIQPVQHKLLQRVPLKIKDINMLTVPFFTITNNKLVLSKVFRNIKTTYSVNILSDKFNKDFDPRLS